MACGRTLGRVAQFPSPWALFTQGALTFEPLFQTPPPSFWGPKRPPLPLSGGPNDPPLPLSGGPNDPPSLFLGAQTTPPPPPTQSCFPPPSCAWSSGGLCRSSEARQPPLLPPGHCSRALHRTRWRSTDVPQNPQRVVGDRFEATCAGVRPDPRPEPLPDPFGLPDV